MSPAIILDGIGINGEFLSDFIVTDQKALESTRASGLILSRILLNYTKVQLQRQID